MMHYFEKLDDGYVLSIGETSGNVGNAITEERYQSIRTAMSNKPDAPEGYTYMLRADTLKWELVEQPPQPEPEQEYEKYPAWDIRSTTAFAVGDRVTNEGTIYECIKAHNASWTRQPPNAEYWRTI